MKQITISNSKPLSGEINISGAKNATLPILVASLLCDGTLKLKNIPHVSDTCMMNYLLMYLGAEISLNCDETNRDLNGKVIEINAKNIKTFDAPYEIVSKMRASFWVIGPLLTRLGKARVSMPGGCAIGTRPVDIYIDALGKMGADITIDGGYVNAVAKNGRLKGAEITFKLPSVGATHTIMMAATLADGVTTIKNAAKEPEISDLAGCLRAMGAKITGDGTDTIVIKGVRRLKSAEYRIIGDRVEAATYMVAAIMTGGDLILKGLDFYSVLQDVINKLEQIGASVTKIDDSSVRVTRRTEKLIPMDVVTKFYPGFPTDVQAQMMALLSMVEGDSTVDETIFENRFMHVPELNRMGANIQVSGNKAHIRGRQGCFSGAKVVATDLRASVALVLAGMCAKGITTVYKVYHLERGYEFLVDKLNSCGADLNISWKEEA